MGLADDIEVVDSPDFAAFLRKKYEELGTKF
jgi:hypothetical protein